jgi:hypothetical protein
LTAGDPQPEPNLLRSVTIVGRRTRGYTVNLYREKPGVKVVRRGRYRRVKVGPLSLEWYPS